MNINLDGENVRWIFEGLTNLIAVYKELGDGAEIIWTEHENQSLIKIRRLVKNKENLEVFDRED